MTSTGSQLQNLAAEGKTGSNSRATVVYSWPAHLAVLQIGVDRDGPEKDSVLLGSDAQYQGRRESPGADGPAVCREA